MYKLARVTEIKAKPEEVFAYIDDIRNVGGQMHGMGGHLDLEILSENDRGLGAKYQWTGKILGFRLKFTEMVTKWELNKEKKYEAIEGAEFSLHHLLEETEEGTKIKSDLEYKMPLGIIGEILHSLFLQRYVKKGFTKVMDGLKEQIEAK